MKIVFLGSGNVAQSLAELFGKAGHTIAQVMSRSVANARSMAARWNCAFTSNYAEIIPDADLYIVAIADKALGELMIRWRVSGRLVVHTAGTVPMAVLSGVSDQIGVLYPLQSLKGSLPVTGRIPFLLAASGEKELAVLAELVQSTGSSFQTATDQQRLQMHVTAVWVNNFPNLMYSIAHRLCADHKLSFELLLPLINETAARLYPVDGMPADDPFQWQTGPAMREDNATVRKHLELMSPHPDWQDLYEHLTEEIVSLKQQTLSTQ